MSANREQECLQVLGELLRQEAAKPQDAEILAVAARIAAIGRAQRELPPFELPPSDGYVQFLESIK
jgi:hypothetical protein